MLLSKLFLRRLIWQSLDLHAAVSSFIWSSSVKLQSSVTPRSLAVETGVINLPRKNKDISWGSFCNMWRVAIRKNLVLSAMINKLFVQHQAATRNKSFSIFWLAEVESLIEKDKRILESSTVILGGLYYQTPWRDRTKGGQEPSCFPLHRVENQLPRCLMLQWSNVSYFHFDQSSKGWNFAGMNYPVADLYVHRPLTQL